MLRTASLQYANTVIAARLAAIAVCYDVRLLRAGMEYTSYSRPCLFFAYKAAESSCGFLWMEPAEPLLLDYRLVVVDVVSVLVPVVAVIVAVAAPLQREGQRDRQNYGQHHQYYYQCYHLWVVEL